MSLQMIRCTSQTQQSSVIPSWFTFSPFSVESTCFQSGPLSLRLAYLQVVLRCVPRFTSTSVPLSLSPHSVCVLTFLLLFRILSFSNHYPFTIVGTFLLTQCFKPTVKVVRTCRNHPLHPSISFSLPPHQKAFIHPLPGLFCLPLYSCLPLLQSILYTAVD